jgi:hypothetical protein
MKLIEVFSMPDLDKYTYTVASKSSHKEVYQFTLQDGQRFIVTFKMLSTPESSEIYYKLLNYVKTPERLNDPTIADQIRKSLGGIYYVTFQDAAKGENEYDATNKNIDMFYILGHVTKILVDFTKNHKILELSFASESKELSRIKVYNRMSTIIPRYTNLKLLTIDKDSSIFNYIFTSKQ